MRVPVHHDVRAKDVDLTRLGAVLAVSYERQLQDFASLLLLENLGPRTLQSLALIAEVIHGTPTRFTDPARFSFALGGKDGTRSRCRSRPTTSRSPCCAAASMPRNLATPTRSTA